jgi:hypothetical protein
MQKLRGTSSGKNNKSCRIFHHESNKIDFVVFRLFYNFLHNLQETAKALYYWSYHFARRPSERFLSSQCGPWAAGRCGTGEIPAGVAGVRPGEGGEEV